MQRLQYLSLLILALFVGASCGSDDTRAEGDVTEDGHSKDVAQLDTGGRDSHSDATGVSPLDLEAGEWRWFEQPGSLCNDGSETGFAVNLGARDKLIVFFMGGGACHDYDSCYVDTLTGEDSRAAMGPYTAETFEAAQANELSDFSGILKRGDPDNPFDDRTYVYVPYCTGDFHSGYRSQPYEKDGDVRVWHHQGGRNVDLLLPRLQADFPSLDKLLVSGVSAGGFGALLQYHKIRDALAPRKGYLVDDSGPPIGSPVISADLFHQWQQSWGLKETTDPICADACDDDLELFFERLSQRYPDDRLALMSYIKDGLIALFMEVGGEEVEAALNALYDASLGALANVEVFYQAGSAHTFLGYWFPELTESSELGRWLDEMAADDPAWESRLP